MKKLQLIFKLKKCILAHQATSTRLTILATLFFASSFYTEITFSERITMNEITELAAILKNASSNTLVIFDVDEVLIYPENIVQLQIASPFWEASMTDIERRLGKNTRDLLHSIMLLQTSWKLTDEIIPKLIRNLQLQKIRILALTAFRSGEMGKLKSVENWRNTQLKKYNIDFNITAGVSKNYFEIPNLNEISEKKDPVYKEGIIYTNHHPKGKVLRAFLEQINFRPKEIIFIDDRLGNIQDVESFCKSANIKFIGIHDNRIMKKFNAFNERLGKYQFYNLEHHYIWLSDLEAERMIGLQKEIKTTDFEKTAQSP